MFCPKCRVEYREGFTECADCEVPLVFKLPPSPAPEYDVEFEEVLSTYNAGDIAIIKSILHSEKLSYLFKGEHFQSIGLVVEPARLMVRKDQVQRAKALLKGLTRNSMG